MSNDEVRRSFLEGPVQFQSRKARETSIGTNELAILFNRERSKIGVRNIVAGRICFAAESDKDFPMTNACVYRSSHGRRAQRFDEIKRCECRRGCFEIRRLVAIRRKLASVGLKRPTGSSPLSADSSQPRATPDAQPNLRGERTRGR